MACICKEAVIEAPAAEVWEALRDVGAVHVRLAPGFVTDCRMDGEARIVTFFNGLVARELIVDIDDQARRVAYSARSDRLQHHNASAQVFGLGPDRCRLVWTADLLPHEAAGYVSTMMDQGIDRMRATLASHSRTS